MFDCGGGYRSQLIGGQREKFVRLDDLDSPSIRSQNGVKKCGLNLEGWTSSTLKSNSFRDGMKKGSEGLKLLGQSLRYGVSRAVFPEDLKVADKTIYDPQNRYLQIWNRLFVICCILSVSVDPLFFYLPVVDIGSNCFGFDQNLAVTVICWRTALDLFYGIRIYLQFRTAFIAPSSRVFGRGELVIDPGQIAERYLKKNFIIDFSSVLPIPQIVVARYLHNSGGSTVLTTRTSLHRTIMFQYIPRFFRILPLSTELKRTAGVFAETAWAGAAYYLLWYMLASHTVGAYWYLLAVEREDACWRDACGDPTCQPDYLYCGNQNLEGFGFWRNISAHILTTKCSAGGDNNPFNFGIFTQALSSGIVASRNFLSKYCYCLWWGLQNLSTLGQGLQTSTYIGEVMFSIALAILGLILFALLIGNMQTYLQSLTIRLEEMRVKRRDSEQWMHHRLLPKELRERVRRYDQYKWLETRGVDEESLVQTLPKDLRRDIKRHLCLALVRRVPLFESMDERLLDAICERLKPALFTEGTYIVREGDPVDEMLFIIRGRLESVTTDGGRSGFFNRGLLKDGDFCGEELLTWALDPKSAGNLPSSTRTVKALAEVEAFALIADELKFVASQFRRLHSRQVQHTFRFYSQQWRTWAACFIQAAWRRYAKRKNAEFRRMEEEEELESPEFSEASSPSVSVGSPRFAATIYASRFAANALRGVHKMRKVKSGGGGGASNLVKLQKPPEPDFALEDAD